MAATSALGFEPVLSEFRTGVVRVPPVLIGLEDEEREEEEDGETLG